MLRLRAHGFSLIELLVVMAIIGILAAIGMPALSRLVDDAAVSSQTDMALSALQYTRSEAVKRNTRVTMCRSDDGATCSAASSRDWRSGWVIFVDGGSPAQFDGTDAVLRVQRRIGGRTVLLSDGNITDYVSYVGSGQIRSADGGIQAGAFTACIPSTNVDRRRIALEAGTGWVGVERLPGAATCSVSS